MRRSRVAATLSDHNVQAILVTALPNIRYLTGFTGSNAVLLLTVADSLLFTDPRYTIQAFLETSCKTVIVRGPILPKVVAAAQKKKLRRIGFEKSRISFQSHYARYWPSLHGPGGDAR